MSILSILKDVIKRNFHPRDPEYWARKFWGGTESKSGVPVDEESAMKYSAYSSGVRLIAKSIAMFPLNVYKDKGEKGKEKASNHPLHRILHDQPNPDMDSFTWRETSVGHVLGWGNHYSLIKRNPLKRYVEELYPLEPWRVKPEMVNTSVGRIKVYRYQPEEGSEVVLLPEDILHIHGFGFNGLVGKSPLGWYREQIGLGLAMEEYSSRYFSNGLHAGGVFSTPQALKPDTYERLKAELKKNYAGLGKSHETILLEQDLKFYQLSVNPNDSQLLESKKFQITEIARILDIPLPFLHTTEPISDNNIEHLNINLVTFCLLPWAIRYEQAYNMQLFPENEKGIYFTKHIVTGLLRGDTATRWEAYVKAIQNGVYSQNDVLEMEDKNPYDGGNKHWIQLNMQSVEDVGNLINNSREIIINGNEIRYISKEVKAIESAESRDLSPKLAEKLGKAYKPLFVNALIRVLKREKVDVLKIPKDKSTGEVVKGYYKKHKEFVSKQIKPVIFAFAEGLGAETDLKSQDIIIYADSYSQDFVERYIENNSQELLATEIEQWEVLFNDWLENKPEILSTSEILRMSTAFSKYIEKIGA